MIKLTIKLNLIIPYQIIVVKIQCVLLQWSGGIDHDARLDRIVLADDLEWMDVAVLTDTEGCAVTAEM